VLASAGLHPEPVSPELVLVDPELARRERARLEEKARLASLLDIEVLRRAVEREAGHWDDEAPFAARRDLRSFARHRLLPAVLLGSLFANGVLAAALVVRTDDSRAIGAAPAAARSVDVAPTSEVQVSSTVAPGGAAAATTSTPGGRPSRLPQRALVERRLVSLILQAPARKLPRAFLDPSTGLVRNNVQVTCRRAQSRSYLCAVQMPNVDATGGILVRYRRGRAAKGAFTWYGYKPDIKTARFLQSRRQ
jgi:hypothetical protein